jgi:hypothetical protein
MHVDSVTARHKGGIEDVPKLMDYIYEKTKLKSEKEKSC